MIRGRNIYPHDIEEAMRQLDRALAAGVAFSVPGASGEELVIVQGLNRRQAAELDVSALTSKAQRMLAERFSLKAREIVFVPPGRIARTTSGKVQRKAMRAVYLSHAFGGAAVAPGNDTPPFAPATDDRAEALTLWLRHYAERLDLRTMDERRSLAPNVVLDFGRKGILGLEVPEVWNGLGLGVAGALRVTEQIAAIDLSLAAFVGVQNALGVGPSWCYGSVAQREWWLKDAAAGRLLVSFALTEEEQLV